MPKKIPDRDKREWLRRYDEGDSEAKIARDFNRSVKTVKGGIKGARTERDAQIARLELLKEALRKHQDRLMTIVKEIISSAQPPQIAERLKLPVSLPGAEVTYESDKGLVLVLDSEDKLEWKLHSCHFYLEFLRVFYIFFGRYVHSLFFYNPHLFPGGIHCQ